MTTKFDFGALKTGFTADWPVKVGVPTDGGVISTQEFTARFRTPTKEEAEKLVADFPNYIDRMKEAVRLGFVALGKAETETLTPAMFEEMWAAQNVQLALVKAYSEFQTSAPAKN